MPAAQSLLTSFFNIFNYKRKKSLWELFQKAGLSDHIVRKTKDDRYVIATIRHLINTASLGSFIARIPQTEWIHYYHKAAIMVIAENVSSFRDTIVIIIIIDYHYLVYV